MRSKQVGNVKHGVKMKGMLISIIVRTWISETAQNIRNVRNMSKGKNCILSLASITF